MTSLKIQLPLATVMSENGISMMAHSRSATARLHRNRLVRVRMPRFRRTTTMTSVLPITAPHMMTARLSARAMRHGTVQYGGCGCVDVEFDTNNSFARSCTDDAVTSSSPVIDDTDKLCQFNELSDKGFRSSVLVDEILSHRTKPQS